MDILKKAQAGTMQSSDIMVFIEPSDDLELEIESTVAKQFEHLIREKVMDTLKQINVTKGYIRVSDRGALDYAIEARVKTAAARANGGER